MADPTLQTAADLDPEAQPDQLPNGITSQDTAVDVPMADQPASSGAATNARAPLADARIPAKKDASLREFLSKMDEHAPIVRLPLLLFQSCP